MKIKKKKKNPGRERERSKRTKVPPTDTIEYNTIDETFARP